MQLNPILAFNGQCEAAFKFYERCHGGEFTFMLSHGESPMADQVAPEWRDKIMHATLTVGDRILMGGDGPPESYEAPRGISLSIGINDTAEAERIFDALAEKGTVQMPLQETFWAAR